MKERTWKRIGLCLLFLVLVIAVAAIRYARDSTEGQLTGTQYLEAQEKYMAEFEVFASDIDDVMTLYLCDSITEEDFSNHLAVFQQELKLMQAAYLDDKEKHPVAIATHTYATKRGCEAVEECYGIFHNILDMMEHNYADKDVLSYKYLASHQDITKAVADYMTALEEQEE